MTRSLTRISLVTLERLRKSMLWLMAAFYFAAGLLHLRSPDAFLPIVPDWAPRPRELVLFTGVCELAGAAGLLLPRLRGLAGIMLALYAVCVFPANVKHAVYNVHLDALPSSLWYHVPRLLAQPVLVWWALFCAGVINWPLRARPKSGAAPKPRADDEG